MTYAEAVNGLEVFLDNLDAVVSFEGWMEKTGEQINTIFGNNSPQQRNFTRMNNDFETSKIGLTDPVKYRINERNFRLRAKAFISSLMNALKDAEQLALREAERKKRDAESLRIKEQEEAEEKRLQEELEVKQLKEQAIATATPGVIKQKKLKRATTALILAPFLAAGIFYGGYCLGSGKEEKEKMILSNENRSLKQMLLQARDSVQLLKSTIIQTPDTSAPKVENPLEVPAPGTQ